MNILIFLITFFLSLEALTFPIPRDNKATFDVIRKNKIIGSVETTFIQNDIDLFVKTVVDIEIKVLFFPAYKFFQSTQEIWRNKDFISIEGYTDFEDEREYYISGKDVNNKFIASGMDGKLILEKNILPLNYWNKKILKEKKLFDTQKGIVRNINVERLKNEIIKLGKIEIETEKYILNASKNSKDKGPFPQYTLWYDKKGELIKFIFTNWKDNKEIITQRNNWIKN